MVDLRTTELGSEDGFPEVGEGLDWSVQVMPDGCGMFHLVDDQVVCGHRIDQRLGPTRVGFHGRHNGLPARPEIDPLRCRGNHDPLAPGVGIKPSDGLVEAVPRRIVEDQVLEALLPPARVGNPGIVPGFQDPHGREAVSRYQQP